LFPVNEKEGLVVAVIDTGNPYRTTHAETVIVAPLAGTQQMSIPVVGEGSAGVETFIDQVVVAAAVKLVRARLHGEVKQTPASLPEFRSIVAGLNRNLLDRLDAGLGGRGRSHSTSTG